MRLSLLNCELGNVFLLIFVWILSLLFLCNCSLFWKICLLFAILWNFQRPITNYNLSDEITWEYLTKISGSDDLWWSLQLWDNIEKNNLWKKLSRMEFINSAQHLSWYTFLKNILNKDVNNIEKYCLQK